MSVLERGCFFFQAEDGIRDLVRSRGLGDVYKRQHFLQSRPAIDWAHGNQSRSGGFSGNTAVTYDLDAVSYTHLTLPTSDLV
mgnify:CR=1 FL=1